MTPANLTEIEESLKRITQGEWIPDITGEFYSQSGDLIGQCYDNVDTGMEELGEEPSRWNTKFISNAPAYVATLVDAVKAKDKAIKRVLKYLRNPDAQDAELVERILDRALAENITENERKGE